METRRETRRADLVRPRGEHNLLPLTETTAAALAAAFITAGRCVRAFVRCWSGGNSEPRGPVRGRWAARLRSLDGETSAGEAPGAAVEGTAALLHPPDRGEVGSW